MRTNRTLRIKTRASERPKPVLKSTRFLRCRTQPKQSI
nr:MAG TPA: hypothetical protein [Caudoviricetes sp.]